MDDIKKITDEVYELLMNDNINIGFGNCYSEAGFTQVTIIYKGYYITVFSRFEFGIDKDNFIFEKMDDEKYKEWRLKHL